ncbi:hypothetical protein ABZT16_11650 [Streptomyces flaveolus]|uniref:hypothetical protein n=1 Tax=Streptomyces flaveolus TaxID=67297 RepID=UPI0033AC09F4
MPRVKLANWYGDHKPGDEIDVDDVMLKALHRDGLIAKVVEAPAEQPEQTPAPQQEGPAQPQPAVETGRKRR